MEDTSPLRVVVIGGGNAGFDPGGGADFGVGGQDSGGGVDFGGGTDFGGGQDWGWGAINLYVTPLMKP